MGEMSDRVLVVVGPFGEETTYRIHNVAAAVGAQIAIVGQCEEIVGALQDVQPLAFLIRMNALGAEQACAHVRSQPRLAPIPILGVASELNDLAFAELFAWGGDDLVAEALPDALERRLRALRGRPELSAQAGLVSQPEAVVEAVVAGPAARWRSVMGRALYNGGFAVRFATTAKETEDECRADGVRVVVAADDLEPGGGAHALSTARAAGFRCAWILVAPPKRMADAHAAIASLGPASAMDAFAPPENVLFVANELLAARGVDKRASARLLYGTPVAFRPAGSSEDEVGFSYNISAGGAFVRTLAPADAGQEVWLEMWSPRSERRVRLAGRVAWKRAFGPVGGATVPAGFGAQFTAGLSGDLERWGSGCSAFAADLLGSTP